MDFLDMIQQGITSLAADIAFGVVVLVSFGLVILALLFFLLAVRGLFHAIRRWLTRATWNSVVVSAERKSLHQR